MLVSIMLTEEEIRKRIISYDALRRKMYSPEVKAVLEGKIEAFKEVLNE